VKRVIRLAHVIIRSISASFDLRSGSRRIGPHALRQRHAARDHLLLERGVLALEPRDLALERAARSSGTAWQVQSPAHLLHVEI
jgi:hypothetical protein